ncbi:MAG: F0F1 ATP synthase subunit epsilon [Bacteroidales bacterium]|nr:F0F1 ATP synthase subunit epsilon [Muribaculaceae bacterium]MDO4971353.1 F0F1 ATP synthase subunit epsilon [Bacteroidales bacterium]
MTLKIISAEKIEFEGTVDSVTLPGALGSFQVLKGHAALISSLVPGTMTYVLENGESEKREIAGGVADINSNVVSVCLY